MNKPFHLSINYYKKLLIVQNLKLLIYLLSITTFFTSFSQNNKIESGAFEKPDSIYVVDLKAVDYAFAMPAEIPSGWITFRMENMGDKNHYASIFRSESDLSIEELRSKIDSGIYDFPKSPVGGPGRHSPGHKSDVSIHLEPGNYMMYCTLQTESGKDHDELGMRMAFKVTEEPSGATKPDPDTQIFLQENDMQRTKTFATGKQTVEIKHDGFFYGYHLYRIQDSLTRKRALQQMDGEIGGGKVQWISGAEPAVPGRSTFISYDFAPGEYGFTSHAHVWGIEDRFQIKEEGKLNSPINQEEQGTANEVEVILEENEIKINGSVERGTNTFFLKNNASGQSQVGLFRLADGENKESFLSWYESGRGVDLPPILGTSARLQEGNAVTLDIQPGTYLIYCVGKSKPCDTGEAMKEFELE